MNNRSNRRQSRKKSVPRPRGIDFLIRNEQGRWAEDLVIAAIDNTPKFKAVRYGISRAILVKGGEEWARYWEKYKQTEKIGKRPNVIVFRKDTYEEIKHKLKEYESMYGDTSLIPEEIWYRELRLCEIVCAIEVEMSLWKASKMPDKEMTLPLKKRNVIAPMIWVKEEDAQRIIEWCKWYEKVCGREIPVYIIQVFYDMAYIASLKLIMEKAQKINSCNIEDKNKIMREEGLIIESRKYVDEVTGVAVERKVYRLHPAGGARVFGYLTKPPEIKVEILEDEKGKIVPLMRFVDGKLEIINAIIKEWDSITCVSCH